MSKNLIARVITFGSFDSLKSFGRMFTRIGRGSRSFARSFATYVSQVEKDCTSITPPYALLAQTLNDVRKVLKRPLTLAEKILYSHLIDPTATLSSGGRIRGEVYLQLRPERVAMQDASAQSVECSVSFPSTDAGAGWHCEDFNAFPIVIFYPAMARLQFMSAGLQRCAVPTSIHCDHLIQAAAGAESDLQVTRDLCEIIFQY